MRIAQNDHYEGNDWWSWAVWIEGKADELRTIESVTYTLHPTFADPVRKVTDRRKKFRLESSGWGGFTVYARLDLKTGKKRNLKHELCLYYPEGHQIEPVTIRINDPKQTDPNRQADALQQAIKQAAPDATVEREPAHKTDATVQALLSVLLTGPTLFSVAKGIQAWLAKNPQATVDLLKQGQLMVSAVTPGNILKALNSLKG